MGGVHKAQEVFVVGDGADLQFRAAQQGGGTGIDHAAVGPALVAAGGHKQQIGGPGPGLSVRGRGKHGGGLSGIGGGEDGAAAAVQVDDLGAALVQHQLGGFRQGKARADGALAAVAFHDDHGAVPAGAQQGAGLPAAGGGVGGDGAVTDQDVAAAGAPDHILPGVVLGHGAEGDLVPLTQDGGQVQAQLVVGGQAQHHLALGHGGVFRLGHRQDGGLCLFAQPEAVAAAVQLQQDLGAFGRGAGAVVKVRGVQIDAVGGTDVVQGVDGVFPPVLRGQGDGQPGGAHQGGAVLKKAHGVPAAVGGDQAAVLNGHACGHAGRGGKIIGVYRGQHVVALVLGVLHHLFHGGFSVKGVAVEHQGRGGAVRQVFQGELLPPGAARAAVELGEGQIVTQLGGNGVG